MSAYAAWVKGEGAPAAHVNVNACSFAFYPFNVGKGIFCTFAKGWGWTENLILNDVNRRQR